jgi:hypothetical protein
LPKAWKKFSNAMSKANRPIVKNFVRIILF